MSAEDIKAIGLSGVGAYKCFALGNEAIEYNARNDESDENEIMPTADGERHALLCLELLLQALSVFEFYEMTVEQNKRKDQDAYIDKHDWQDVLKSPEERNSAQVSEEERRIT